MSNQNEPLLQIRDLCVTFLSGRRQIPAVQHLNLDMLPGRVLGLVGESGCGKSVTSLSIMGLNDMEFTRMSGSIKLEGRELLGLKEKQMRAIRGDRMSMVFQEPMTSLNPVYTVEQQLVETLLVHGEKDKNKAKARAREFLHMVGLADVERIAAAYPHRLSGGQRQRVMIAMALICNPALLIADEPTTALDVTIQAQVLDLITDLQKQLGMAILFITHDLGVIRQVADDVAVMYAGRVVEKASTEELFSHPMHPYTLGLMASRTDASRVSAQDRHLPCIPGNVPFPDQLPPGCAFAPRCNCMEASCDAAMPELVEVVPGHWVRCCKCPAEKEAHV